MEKLKSLFNRLGIATEGLKRASILNAKTQAIECADLTLETVRNLIVELGQTQSALKGEIERGENLAKRLRELEARQGIRSEEAEELNQRMIAISMGQSLAGRG
jgi:hypothetical protein